MKHCNIYNNYNAYDTDILQKREMCKNYEDYDSWEEILPFVSICEDNSHIYYNSYEYTITVNNSETTYFIQHGDSYTNQFGVVLPTGVTPNLTIIMNGIDVSDKYGKIENNTQYQQGRRYIVNIPYIKGNVTINYVS